MPKPAIQIYELNEAPDQAMKALGGARNGNYVIVCHSRYWPAIQRWFAGRINGMGTMKSGRAVALVRD